MSRRKFTFAQEGLAAFGKLEKPQNIGHMASAFADDFGEIELCIAEFIDKLLIAHRFLDRIEIAALDVFDDREFERLTIIGVDADDRHFMQAGALGGAPAALARDDLESADQILAPDARGSVE